MADYAPDISSNNYSYMRTATLTEKSGEDQTNISIELELNDNNFNFSFARSDGKDLRICLGSNGTYVLNMWIARWDVANSVASIWFKVPSLLANEVRNLYIFWGNPVDTGISNVDSVGFLFADDFDSVTLNPNKWNSSGAHTISDSKLTLNDQTCYIEPKNTPLDGIYQWTFGDGFDADNLIPPPVADPYVYWCVWYDFRGGDNEFGMDFFADGGTYTRRHSIVYCGGLFRPSIRPGDPYTEMYWYNDVGKGLESASFCELTVSYDESTDTVFQGMAKRDTNSDYLDSWERRCEGNTRCTHFRIYGNRHLAGDDLHHDYVYLKRYLPPDEEPEIDTSNLYVSYEQINPAALQFAFGSDVTNININHTSDMGGDPYRLSDDIYVDASGIFYSNDNLVTVSGNLIINFGGGRTDLTSINYVHYDSSHVLDYGASKLSDEDVDIHGETYWHGTTTSGWAVIDLSDDNENVGCLMVQAVPSYLTRMAKNFKFQGSYSYTNDWGNNNWQTLYSGQFEQDDDWQAFYFVNGNSYRFYRLKATDTYGQNIAIQEWRMYEYNESMRQMTIGKLRLKPSMLSSEYIYFPKSIKFYASNDFNNWDVLISEIETYTPIGGGWQEYVFANIKPYWSYKLE